MASVIKVGDKWVQFVTEEKLVLTDKREEAGGYSWIGQIQAQELVNYHLLMDGEPNCTAKS